jgi:FXSXX-COOH protein
MPDQQLLDLARARVAEVVERADEPALDSVMRRLFDPAERDRLTVSAFQSAL